jgi:hypothetical protein
MRLNRTASMADHGRSPPVGQQLAMDRAQAPELFRYFQRLAIFHGNRALAHGFGRLMNRSVNRI